MFTQHAAATASMIPQVHWDLVEIAKQGTGKLPIFSKSMEAHLSVAFDSWEASGADSDSRYFIEPSGTGSISGRYGCQMARQLPERFCYRERAR